MQSLRLWWVIALTISMVAVAPREARAGGLGITKKQFIISCNNLLSKFDLRFIVDDGQKIINGAAYKLSSGTATLFVEGNSSQLTQIALIAMNVEGRPEREFLNVMGSVVMSALSQSMSDWNKFLSQWKDNVAQGLKKFTIKIKDKVFDIQIEQSGAVLLTIKPEQ